jgi:hypothetical protein
LRKTSGENRPYGATLVKSRYDAEVDFRLDEAIKRVNNFRALKEKAGQRDDEYAEALFYLACYETRQTDDKPTAGSQNFTKVIELLKDAIVIRPEIRRWIRDDAEFRKLKSTKEFQAL